MSVSRFAQRLSGQVAFKLLADAGDEFHLTGGKRLAFGAAGGLDGLGELAALGIGRR